MIKMGRQLPSSVFIGHAEATWRDRYDDVIIAAVQAAARSSKDLKAMIKPEQKASL